MGGKSDPPPPPDYKGAAEATGASSLENTRLASTLNRPNVNTPLGSQTWSNLGGDQYQQDINLSPEGQKLLDTGLQTQQMMGDIGNRQLTRADDALSQPIDLSQVEGGQQQIQDALYRRQTSMLDPQFEQQEASERDRLANQGFQVGNEGYDKAIGNFDRAKAFAYGDARDRAIVGGQDARKQAIQEALLQRQTPLNEINALRSGSQVQMPQFQATSPTASADPTQYGAAAAQAGQYGLGTYNSQVAQQNALTQGLFGLGAAGIGAYGMSSGLSTLAPILMAGSDRRIKTNIIEVGVHPLGLKIYEYDIFGRRERGVMAQDVLEILPEAVAMHPDGYLMVDYAWLI